MNVALDAVQAGDGRFRRAAGRAGIGDPADDDDRADHQARRRLGAGALPDRRDRDRLHAARRAVARASVRHRAAHRDQPAVRDRRCAGTRRDRAGGGAAQPALPRLSAGDRTAGAAVRLLGFRALCRSARRQLSDRAAAPEDRPDAGGARHLRRRGHPVRHPRRERGPRCASRFAGRPAEIPVADRVAPGAEPRGPQGARGKRVPGRRRLSAVRHAGTGAGDDHRHRAADLSSGGGSDRGPGLRQSRLRRRLLRHGPRRHGGAGR